ncbi:hypothetical protein BN132_1502 [Cronobacter turicensis 564]|nr:hypothetical protein BN132_1502 [Cronobacter turicensis 564]
MVKAVLRQANHIHHTDNIGVDVWTAPLRPPCKNSINNCFLG